MKDTWNKCDVCGAFISFADFENGIASRKMTTPDSAYSAEDYETLCRRHYITDLLYKSFDPNFGGFCSDKSIDCIKKAINLIEKT